MNVKFYPLNVERDWQFVNQVIHCVLCTDVKGIVAVDEDANQAVAIVVLDSWAPKSVQCHLWIGNPLVLRHGFFEEIGRYVFGVCNRDVMIGLVPSNNEKALKLNSHIGFREIFRVKDGYDLGVDYVVMEGRREDFTRWLPAEERAA